MMKKLVEDKHVYETLQKKKNIFKVDLELGKSH